MALGVKDAKKNFQSNSGLGLYNSWIEPGFIWENNPTVVVLESEILSTEGRPE